MKAPIIIPNMIEIEDSINFNNLSTYLFIDEMRKGKILNFSKIYQIH